MKHSNLFFTLPLLVLLCSCAPRIFLEKSSFDQLHGWNGNQKSALAAFNRSCEKLGKLPDNRDLGVAGKAADWRTVCEEAKKSKHRAKEFFETNFVPFKAKNYFKSEGLFTGYYEPVLRGSLRRDSKYKYAVYQKPKDLVDGQPYLGRRRIIDGELSRKGLAIAFVDDPVDLFFLQIQGSGRIILEDGRIIRVGYDAKNGCPYRALGKYMIDNGIMKKGEITADKIKDWLRANPDKANDVMNYNPSYVFFRVLKTDPIGAQGVPLIPEASLAVDKKFVPYGTPIWLETTLPDTGKGEKEYNKLLIAQDTGGAIKGPVRGDVFFGRGNRAAKLASFMKQKGEYYLLLPKKVAQSPKN